MKENSYFISAECDEHVVMSVLCGHVMMLNKVEQVIYGGVSSRRLELPYSFSVQARLFQKDFALGLFEYCLGEVAGGNVAK